MTDMETKKKCAASTDTARPSTEDNGADNHQTGKPTAEIKFHPIAEIFPLMKGAELDVLVADIGEHGLLEPIVTFEGKILDGRNRYRACIEADVEPKFQVHEDDDPLAFVISKNVHRRRLDESQRAMSAARLTKVSGETGKFAGLTQKQAEKLFNVSERLVRDAAYIIERAAPELEHMVTRGEVAVSAAVVVAKEYDVEEQGRLVAKGAEKIREAATRTRKKSKKKKKASLPKRPAMPSDDNGPAPAGDGSTAVGSAAFRDRPRQDVTALRHHLESLGHDVDPVDIVVAPDSKSAGARQSEYALIRVPASHPDREGLKTELHKLRDRYNTHLIFKLLPQPVLVEPIDAAENAIEAAHDA